MGIQSKVVTWLCGVLAFSMQAIEPGDIVELYQKRDEVYDIYQKMRLDQALATIELNAIVRTITVLFSASIMLVVNWTVLVEKTYQVRANSRAWWQEFTSWKQRFCKQIRNKGAKVWRRFATAATTFIITFFKLNK